MKSAEDGPAGGESFPQGKLRERSQSDLIILPAGPPSADFAVPIYENTPRVGALSNLSLVASQVAEVELMTLLTTRKFRLGS